MCVTFVYQAIKDVSFSGMDKQKHELELLKIYLDGLKLKHNEEFGVRDMQLHDNSPHPRDYVPTNKLTENTHAGQMKLLLADEWSIMLGLLHICDTANTTLVNLTRLEKVAVVVAGAAPGDHFEDLSKTFGFVDFHLYDPSPNWHDNIYRRDRRPANVFIYEEPFRVETARQWKDKKVTQENAVLEDYVLVYQHVIFLSDLRVADALKPSDDQVQTDMVLQKELTEEMNACYSVLKFRPRFYDPRKEQFRMLKYFDGTIYFQGYPPRTSTETRLHVTDTKSEKTYDTLVYEKQLFYHNQVTRNKTKTVFGPSNLSYDNSHARFVYNFLRQYVPVVSQEQRDKRNPHVRKFDHLRVQALLEDFKLLAMQL